jgi:hypothetical protein
MRKKISSPKKINSEIEKYPMVSVEWFDIVSDSSWTSFDALKKSNLATCITKGHLLSQSKGVTRLFGDYSFAENGKDIESIGNTTIIPNSKETLSKRSLKLYRPVSVFTDPRSLKPRSSFSFPYHWPTVQQQLVKELVQPEAEEQELVLVSRPC